MKLTRSDLEAALEDLDVALKAAAEAYEDSAGLVADDARASLFRRHAEAARADSAAIDAALRDSGALPRNPDADGTALKEIFRHAWAAIAPEESENLVRDRCADEEEVVAYAEAVLDAGPGEEVRAVVAEVRDAAGLRIRALDATAG